MAIDWRKSYVDMILHSTQFDQQNNFQNKLSKIVEITEQEEIAWTKSTNGTVRERTIRG